MATEYGYRREDRSLEWVDENGELLTRNKAEAVAEAFPGYVVIAREVSPARIVSIRA